MGDKLGKHGLYVELAMRLSKANVASLRCDFIGCGDSEGKIKNESIGSQVSQVKRQVQYLGSLDKIDTSSMGLIGNSLGGAVACLSLKELPNIKCLSLTGAIANGRLWLDEWEKGNPGKSARKEFFITDETFNEFENMRPMINVKNRKDVSTLIIHGKEDDIVSKAHYDLFSKEINAKSKVMLLENVGHYYGAGPQREIYLDETSNWMIQHLT